MGDEGVIRGVSGSMKRRISMWWICLRSGMPLSVPEK